MELALICHRCTRPLEPGHGDFYLIRIEALADPSPPHLNDLPEEPMDQIIADLADSSERELMDQVHRRMTMHLCRACYEQWIEDPAGGAA